MHHVAAFWSSCLCEDWCCCLLITQDLTCGAVQGDAQLGKRHAIDFLVSTGAGGQGGAGGVGIPGGPGGNNLDGVGGGDMKRPRQDGM